MDMSAVFFTGFQDEKGVRNIFLLFFYPPLQTIKKAVLTRFLSSQHRLLYYMKFSTVSHLREEINNERQDPHHNEDSKHSLPHDP